MFLCCLFGCLIIHEEEASLVRARTRHSHLSSSRLEWRGNGGRRRPSLLLPKPRLRSLLQGFSCRWHRYSESKFQQIGSGKPGLCLLQSNKLPVRSSKLQGEHIGEVFHFVLYTAINDIKISTKAIIGTGNQTAKSQTTCNTHLGVQEL